MLVALCTIANSMQLACNAPQSYEVGRELGNVRASSKASKGASKIIIIFIIFIVLSLLLLMFWVMMTWMTTNCSFMNGALELYKVSMEGEYGGY